MRTSPPIDPGPSFVPPSIDHSTQNYSLLLKIGAAIAAVTCLFTLTVAALALASVITLSTTALASELIVAAISGVVAFGLFRTANTNSVIEDADPDLHRDVVAI